jgi:arabinofuranan 3-O-arabinosyltransferase
VLADGRHSVPTRLRLEVDGQKRDLRLPAVTDQAPENASTLVHLEFPRVTGRAVRVTITGVREERSLRFASDATALLPAGIAELGVPGLRVPAAPTIAASGALDSACRSDLVAIDGRPVPVRVTGPATGADAVMALAVTPCDPADARRTPTIELGPGRHVLTTARGVDAGWSVDRLVLASGEPGARVNVADGRITAIGAPAPVPPRVEVVRNGATSMRVHVTGATRPFWMVLGESQSPGWRASVVGGHSLGGSQLVDGYANGWLVNPEREAFDITLQWTPQRQVWAALWISLVAALGSLVIVALTWKRRTAFAVAAKGDAEVSAGAAAPIADSTRRLRWLAPLLAGLLAAIAVSPVVGLVVAALIAVVAWRPSLRRAVMVLPAALLFGCGLYVAVQQYRYRFPAVFEWPTLFARARTAAWIAVMLLAGDVILELVRTRRAAAREDRDDRAATLRERSVESTYKNGAHGDDPDG